MSYNWLTEWSIHDRLKERSIENRPECGFKRKDNDRSGEVFLGFVGCLQEVHHGGYEIRRCRNTFCGDYLVE